MQNTTQNAPKSKLVWLVYHPVMHLFPWHSSTVHQQVEQANSRLLDAAVAGQHHEELVEAEQPPMLGEEEEEAREEVEDSLAEENIPMRITQK